MNFFGNGDNCACSLIWILLLLSCCGNGNGSCFGGENNSCIWIILLLLLCGGCGNDSACGNNQNCGCGCGC